MNELELANWNHFAALLGRDEHTLTADEKVSRDYFSASIDEGLGAPANDDASRWCRLAREVGYAAKQIGRIPTSKADGVAPRHLRWIHEQCTTELNSYQRSRLEEMPGWSWT